MHDIINYLKAVVNRSLAAGVDSCYVIRDGSIYARGTAMTAGVAWADDSRFTLSADALDAALSRMKVIDSITVEENSVIIKSGRLRSNLKRIHLEPPPIPDFPDEWRRSPPGLAHALSLARPFTDENKNSLRWTVGVRLYGDRVTAFSGAGGIDINLPGLELERPYLLSDDVTAFLAAQGDPDEMLLEQNAISFRWDDGRWMRTKLIDDEMPEGTITTIFQKVGSEAPVQVDQSWREAVADATALGDSSIGVSIAGLHALKENVTTDIDLSIDVTADHKSWWDTKMLGKMAEVATAWNPGSYPEAALFTGPSFRGVITGVRR